MKRNNYWDKKTIDKIRQGYYSAVYFNRTKEILLKENNLTRVTMQIFQKNDNTVLCGIQQTLELLKIGTGYFKNGRWIPTYDELTIKVIPDGEIIQKGEPVMHITGPYIYFAHLESLYLGMLARQTRIATNARNITTAANGKPVLFFADRFDYFLNQEPDGYAAYIGQVTSVCTKAQGNWSGIEPVGTIPHALIAINNGNAISATKQFQKYFPSNTLVALVDFDNDCVTTSVKVAKEFGKDLWGIRMDTAENMIDKSLQELSKSKNQFYGINPTLVKMVRKALDKEGYQYIKIIVSGGFNKDKITLFEKEKTPVDIYAVGSAMFEGKNDFTADIVEVAGEKIAKTGRKLQKSIRLKSLPQG